LCRNTNHCLQLVSKEAISLKKLNDMAFIFHEYFPIYFFKKNYKFNQANFVKCHYNC